jgi:hypothetical protein
LIHLQKYKAAGQDTIVLAGSFYGKVFGNGSSRDWAAKGPALLVSLNFDVPQYLPNAAWILLHSLSRSLSLAYKVNLLY